MRPNQLTIRGLLLLIAAVSLAISYVNNFRRLRSAEAELAKLRDEVGYLQAVGEDEIAAVRIASEEPLTWQTRVRIPRGKPYRVAYSAVWRAETSKPEWFAAQPLPIGESIVTVRVAKDPRDDRWKISTIVRHEDSVAGMGTALPEEISAVFRGHHDVMSAGVARQTVARPAGETLRILDERYFSGRSLLLYGDRAPEEDLIGVYAELQPDIGPL